MNEITLATTPMAKTRCRNSDTSSIGLRFRSSQYVKKPASPTTTMNPATIGGARQPISAPLLMASRNTISIAVDVIAPTRSNRPPDIGASVLLRLSTT